MPQLPSLQPYTARSSSPSQSARLELSSCSPRIKLSRSITASELLASFSPKSLPRNDVRPWVSPPKLKIKMTDRHLRHRNRISYNISDDSDTADSPSGASTFSSPEKPKRNRTIIDLEDEELEVIELATTPPPRLSSAGHSLRQHKDLHLSLRAQENGDKPVSKKRRTNPSSHKKQPTISLTSNAPAPTRTARNEIRDSIATKTAGKRAKFFVAKKECFLPLLPESNHVSRLVEQHEHAQAAKGANSNADMTVPYELLETQPKG